MFVALNAETFSLFYYLSVISLELGFKQKNIARSGEDLCHIVRILQRWMLECPSPMCFSTTAPEPSSPSETGICMVVPPQSFVLPSQFAYFHCILFHCVNTSSSSVTYIERLINIWMQVFSDESNGSSCLTKVISVYSVHSCSFQCITSCICFGVRAAAICLVAFLKK